MLDRGAFGRRGPAAGASGSRLAWGMLLATSLAVCIVPMGCASSDEHAAAPERTASSLPKSTIEALQACAEKGAGRLQHHSYEIRFEVALEDDGTVGG
jgi:hypothetical protein